jgi:hypothetical protein
MCLLPHFNKNVLGQHKQFHPIIAKNVLGQTNVFAPNTKEPKVQAVVGVNRLVYHYPYNPINHEFQCWSGFRECRDG